jgi:dihydrofolate synthase/folylpolyglutamate synthase
MDHQETLDYLDKKGNEVQMMHLGLHRTLAMMRTLGNPHTKYPSIHIAGTNGKGSVAAMSESILRHSGLKTGLYTSPHLIRVEERIRINSRPVSPRRFAILGTRVRQVEEILRESNEIDRPLTTFEFLTACAFLHFAQQKVDVAVVEVGLGGKLDATNVVHPMVSVISGVSLDHQNYLGRTIGKIAREKAGIIKERTPVISGCSDPVVQNIVRNRARSAKATLLELSSDFSIKNQRQKAGRPLFDLRMPEGEYKNLRLSLAGDYQARNAALSVMALRSQKLFRIKVRDIRKGLRNAHWEGRLDEYRADRRTLLDGAHNPEAAGLLRKFLLKRKESEIHFVFGAVRDKNIQEIGEAIFPLAARIHLTPLVNARSCNPIDVAAMHPQYRSRMTLHPDMKTALLSAWRDCPRSGLVVITGSLYLVGELLPIVQAHTSTRKKF